MKYLSILLLFALFGISDNAPKEKRYALLIGNGKYNKTYYSPLKNPPNDVDDLKKVLKKKGFEVTIVKNADYDKMDNAITGFVGKIRRAAQNKNQRVVSLFYFGGHGNHIKDEDESYLVPIGSKITFPEHFKKRAYKVSELLDLLRGSGNYLNIVMLDACRDNFVLKDKFKSQVAGDGYDDMFEGVEPHKSDKSSFNLFVSYATAKDAKALSTNGEANNSPYVSSFKEVMRQNPSFSIYRFFPKVHKKTQEKSKINRPELSIDFSDDFFFEEPKEEEKPPIIQPKDPIVDNPKTEVPRNMVDIEGGTFKMGRDGGGDEAPAHQTKVNGFYMDKYEVSVEEYLKYAKATGDNPEWLIKGNQYHHQTGSDDHYKRMGSALTNSSHPIVGVSWYNAVKYCNWRSKQDNLTPCYTINGTKVTCNWNANGYRLPTEAEWEYAAGGGAFNRTKYAGTNNSSDLSKYANTSGESDGYKYTSPVDKFLPNAKGLYGISGNVWEWCWDWYDEKYYTNFSNTTARNPKGAASGSFRVLRGGSWNNNVSRVAYRNRDYPANRDNLDGFRCIRVY